jgi:phospholipase D
MYGLTSRSIVDALIAAQSRGVDVAIKTDKKESEKHAQATLITKLKAAGVRVEVSTQQRNLHDKFAVIDGQRVITGSFNWTQNAELRNRENLVVLDCREIAAAFEREWQSIQQDAP